LFFIEKLGFGTGYLTKNTSPSQLATYTRNAVKSENKCIAGAEDCMAEAADGQDCWTRLP